ncbi:MAG: hypothetical protein JRF32_03755 [Deltaproteobacteria bacterium]|nr:hypothetical protein [Deltaproteobacteria bacterium]MBW2612079.1 hypothetical protein [Deltaproteobacteria bacterium]MBW2676008.1 hypothetical protein [Deltaproteobacteria bacterium]
MIEAHHFSANQYVHPGTASSFKNKVRRNIYEKEVGMHSIRKWGLIGLVLACLVGFTACEKEGGAEKAGKSIDKAMKDLEKKVE